MRFVQWISRLTIGWNLTEAFTDVAHIGVWGYRIEERERERKLFDEDEISTV